MLLFNSDYMEGCHPRILELLQQTNFEQAVGYEQDQFCERARELIRNKCEDSNVDVHFFTGGTLTNLTVIAAALRPHQGVISSAPGHVATHETGAIEATGHKVLTLPSADAKLTAQQIDDYFKTEGGSGSEHVVMPKMVYISHPTELGTLYTKAELTALAEACRRHGQYLFMDGARLGYALAVEDNDLDMPTINKLCDVFYIGGNKVGALIGEAVVVRNEELKVHFRHAMKQHGALCAKGRLLGIQFIGLFEDDLYVKIAKNAIDTAMMIRAACQDAGYKFAVESPTNQQFIIFPNHILEQLKKKYGLSQGAVVDENHTAARICTSWCTKKEDVEQLCNDIRTLK